MIRKRPSDPVERFASVAKRYLKWADDWSGDPEEKMRTALRLLIELHAAAVDLTGVCSEDDHEVEEKPHLPRWNALRAKFQELPMNDYVKVFNPRQLEPPVHCTLADDLADIYLDLDKGLAYYNEGYF